MSMSAGSGVNFSARKWIAVTPSDVTNLPAGPIGLFVGGAGNIAAVGKDDSVSVFTAIPAGTTIQISPKRINSTDTTATLILALYA